MPSIKISIITATYNSKKTIKDCIFTVASQDYLNREHIIIDGLSTDGTIDILNANREKFEVVISEKDHGVYDAFNKGIARSNGDVIGFLNSDDLFYEQTVLSRIAKIFENPLIQAVYGDLVYVKKSNINNIVRIWNSSKFHKTNLKMGWMPPHPTLYVRKEWYEMINGFDTSFKISADYYSILQLFSRDNFYTYYLPEILIKMRTGGISNGSLRNIIIKTFEDFGALKKSKVGGIKTVIYKNISKLGQFFKILK